MSKTFYINGRFLTQPITGVQRFAIEICKELVKGKANFKILTLHAHTDYPAELMPYIQEIGKGFKGYAWEQYSLPRWLKKNNNPLLLNLCNTAPVNYSNKVVTIHDLAFQIHPEWFSFKFRTIYSFLIPKIVNKSKLIFTVSEAIKNEINRNFNLNDKKVVVVYNGLPEIFISTEDIQPASFHRPYVMAFGRNNPRKNTNRVIEAMSASIAETHDLRIVSHAEKNFKGSSSKNETWVKYHDPNDNDLVQLYKGAEALVYPSLYEGFGIPPLEALSCNCPIILSNIEVFLELYEGNAIFVDPFNIHEIESGIKKIITKGSVFQLDHVSNLQKRFSYRQSADKILNELDNNLGSNEN